MTVPLQEERIRPVTRPCQLSAPDHRPVSRPWYRGRDATSRIVSITDSRLPATSQPPDQSCKVRLHLASTIVSKLGLPPCMGLREVRTGDRRPVIVRDSANRAGKDDTTHTTEMIYFQKLYFREVDHHRASSRYASTTSPIIPLVRRSQLN